MAKLRQYQITIDLDIMDLNKVIDLIEKILAMRTQGLKLDPDQVFHAQEGDTIFIMSNPVTKVMEDGFKKRNVSLEYHEDPEPRIEHITDSGTLHIGVSALAKAYKFIVAMPEVMPIEHPELIARIKEITND